VGKRTCADEDCDRPVIARGVCTKHYQQLKAQGGLTPLPKPERGQCSVETCDLPERVRGLCNGHYKRFSATGDVQADVPLQKKRRGYTEPCSEPGCGEPQAAKGLCKKHYAEARSARLSLEQCATDGCANPRGNTGGYCPACYQRSLTYGDPTAGPPRRKRRKVTVPAGTTSEYHKNHREVRKARGPAWNHNCEHCGKRAQTWAMKHESDGSQPDDYMALCWPCHAKYDNFAARLPDNTGSRRSPETIEKIRQAHAARSPEAKALTSEKMRKAAIAREARKREGRAGIEPAYPLGHDA